MNIDTNSKSIGAEKTNCNQVGRWAIETRGFLTIKKKKSIFCHCHRTQKQAVCLVMTYHYLTLEVLCAVSSLGS